MTAFKKPKKKKKVKKKMLKADDLLAMIDGDVNMTEENIAEKQKREPPGLLTMILLSLMEDCQLIMKILHWTQSQSLSLSLHSRL